MSDPNTPPRCAGQTKAGTPCRNYPLEGQAYCRLHLPAAAEGSEARTNRLHLELQQELDALLERLRALQPEYQPPPFSAQGFFELLGQTLPKMPAHLAAQTLHRLRQTFGEDALSLETWKGFWFVFQYAARQQADFIRRRFTGEYETDPWGMDWEFVEAVRPFFEFLYYRYWRVQTSGLAKVPHTGRALLVANHSGQLPWDGAMLATALYSEHPAQRLTRTLADSWFPTLPFFSTILERGGQVLASVENGTRLLAQDELVAVFPEGTKGVGKLFKDRYKLARFGRGGFVKMALDTQTPIIPVAIVGAEETYVSLYKSEMMAKLLGMPFFPISLRFPLLGPLALIPFPTKWFIDFGDPIPTDSYEAGASQNIVLVSQLSDQVRNIIQQMLNQRLAKRRSVFFG